MSSTLPRGTPWIRLTWLWRPSSRRYNQARVSLCASRKQPFQQTRVRWGDFPLIPNSIISHQIYQKKSRGMSAMPRGLRITRQTQQHLCQIEPQPRRRSIGKLSLKSFFFFEKKKIHGDPQLCRDNLKELLQNSNIFHTANVGKYI
jgi:hypothetical protein